MSGTHRTLLDVFYVGPDDDDDDEYEDDIDWLLCLCTIYHDNN